MSGPSKSCCLFYDDKDKKKTRYVFETKNGTLIKKRWASVRPYWVVIVNGTGKRKYHQGVIDSTKAVLDALDAQEAEGRVEPMSKHTALSGPIPLSRKQQASKRQTAKEKDINNGKVMTKAEKDRQYEIQRLNNTIQRPSTLPKTRAIKIARLAALGEVPR